MWCAAGRTTPCWGSREAERDVIMEAVDAGKRPPLRLRKLSSQQPPEGTPLSVQIGLSLIVGVLLPLAGYVGLALAGINIGFGMAWIVAAALLVTTGLILVEGVASLHRIQRPDLPTAWYPPASVIILPSAYGRPEEFLDLARTTL